MNFYGGDGIDYPEDTAQAEIERREALEARRNFNIQQKEAARKHLEELKHQKLRQKFAAQSQNTSVTNTKAIEMQKLYEEEVRLRKHRERVENEARNAQRDSNMNIKEENWLYEANLRIRDLLYDADKENKRIDKSIRDAKDGKIDLLKKQAHNRGIMKLRQDALEAKRESEEAIRNGRRHEATLMRNEELKLERDERLNQIQEDVKDGKPVEAEKCSLVAAITANPTVSELLAARKVQMMNLEDLRGCDIEERAKINKKALFSYVKAIDQIFEESKFPIPTGPVTFPPKKDFIGGVKKK